MENEPKLSKEAAKTFLDFAETTKDFHFGDVDLKKAGIENLKLIKEGSDLTPPWLIIKYLDGKEETIKGLNEILIKIKELKQWKK